jgi:hypothetical protein
MNPAPSRCRRAVTTFSTSLTPCAALIETSRCAKVSPRPYGTICARSNRMLLLEQHSRAGSGRDASRWRRGGAALALAARAPSSGQCRSPWGASALAGVPEAPHRLAVRKRVTIRAPPVCENTSSTVLPTPTLAFHTRCSVLSGSFALEHARPNTIVRVM